jgi:hypothetical protein
LTFQFGEEVRVNANWVLKNAAGLLFVAAMLISRPAPWSCPELTRAAGRFKGCAASIWWIPLASTSSVRA